MQGGCGEAIPKLSQRVHGNQGQISSAWQGVLGQSVCLSSIPPGAVVKSGSGRFFPLGRGWHWSALRQLFWQQQGTPDDNPNKARPGNEVISFPFSAGKLLPQGWVI